MKTVGKWLTLVCGLVLVGSVAHAQSTTGTISGRVVDPQGLAVPGAVVTAQSPALQGSQSSVTSGTGDFILNLLPSGTYTLTFTLDGFATQTEVVRLAATQVLPVDVVLGLADLTEEVTVVGGAADVLTRTAQVGTNFSGALLSDLPTTRDVQAALRLAPSVHGTGPNGNYSMSGSMSFENLFLINGVTVNDNLRGQPHDLYVEDAIEDILVATSGISAEYGRFGGGVVNIITKSGGNTFSGSFRDTLNNDGWRAYTPFEHSTIAADPLGQDTRVKKTVPTYEYTLGGPIVRDRLWFFAAGRQQSQESGRSLVVTNTPYTYKEEARRNEIHATFSPLSAHRLDVSLARSTQDQRNQTTLQTAVMDLASLYNSEHPMSLFTAGYSGGLSPNFFMEARFSKRDETIIGVGSTATDRIGGTVLLDGLRGTRFWAPTFCGVCEDEERDNQELFVKGSYFLSRPRLGTHDIVFGYDGFDDTRLANNHQSGSDYRVGVTTAIVQGTGASATLYPQILGNGSAAIIWYPILVNSRGSSFRTHSLFLNDNWRVSTRVTANLGLRYDKNHGLNSADALVISTGAWSPRLGVVIDPLGDGRWAVTGGVARYVASVANTIADAASPGGNANAYIFGYAGPSINADPNGPLTSTPDAIQQVFDWFFANGGPSMPVVAPPVIRGVTPQIGGDLSSPSTMEYAGGLSRHFGARASLRADVTYRDYGNFYVQRTDTSTGRVTDSTGRPYDLVVIENSDLLERHYAGLTTQGTYRFDMGLDVGANYTLSRAWGNVEGETTNGPSAATALQYPEYKEASWNFPVGDLSIDQRHRANLWANFRVPRVPGLTLSLLQLIESGVPYGAFAQSGVDPRPYVTNPGYVSPPNGTQTPYYFTAPDAFRTEGQRRTDLAVGYAYTVHGARRVQVFGQLQVLNILNHYQLCGCGGSVFQSSGTVNRQTIDQTVRTRVTSSALQTFNPFTTTPAEGVNWAYGPTFGGPLNRFAYTSPRELRVTFGVRF